MTSGVDTMASTEAVIADLVQATRRRERLYGQEDHAYGTGGDLDQVTLELVERRVQARRADGVQLWRDSLCEVVASAFAQADLKRLRRELVKVGAVSVAWIEAIDRELETGIKL
uniref:hypothetical protein n=1 Tax=Amycolatopsis sp. CA-290885 TaxID=3239925 RepID=UPI003F492566